jgi:RNA polymerase sigma-70 factor (ECF subfamily)
MTASSPPAGTASGYGPSSVFGSAGGGSGETDRAVLLAKAGDREAIAWLYEGYAPRLHRYFLARLGGHTQQAEDLTMEVFLRVLERLGSYECRGLPFGAWLFRIARNLLIDHHRSLPSGPLLTLEACEDVGAAAAERALDQVISQYDLMQALRRLTREQRQVLDLRFIRGRSLAETRAALGKTEEAVKKLQARGLQAMQRILAEPDLWPAPPVRASSLSASGKRRNS